METKIMNKSVGLITAISCALLLLIGRAYAQNALPTVWTLPPIDCATSAAGCEIRLSLEADLYTLYYSENGPQLYVSRQSEGSYRLYSLNPLWVTGAAVEFIPFSTQNIVIFYSSLNSGTLSRLDLITGEMNLMPQNSEFLRLMPCNTYAARTGSQNYISRLGTGSQLLVCSLGGNPLTTIVSIVDATAQTTLRTFDFGVGWSGEGTGRPWDHLLGGQDGNIYIQSRFGSDWDISQQFPDSLTPLPDWGWRIFRFESSTGIWSIRNINPEQMASPNYPPSGNIENNRIVAVLANGDIIYRYDWEMQDGGEASEISHYDADFNLVERISSETLGRTADFVGISADGLMLVQSGSSLADLSTFQTVKRQRV